MEIGAQLGDRQLGLGVGHFYTYRLIDAPGITTSASKESDANVHLDRQAPGNSLEGQFNGLHLRTLRYLPSDGSDYQVNLEFLALQGSAACVKATAVFASGDTTSALWGDCGAVFTINPGLNDAWINLATAGQGVFVAAYPVLGKIFMAMFTYDVERPPQDLTAILGEPGHRWFTAFGDYAGNDAVLAAELTEGGIFDSSEPAVTQTPHYGTVTATFAACNKLTLSYDFPSLGLNGSINLRRLTLDNVDLCKALQKP